MTRRLHSAAAGCRYPLWVRWAAVFALALFLSASSAQAMHVHGDWFPHLAAQASSHDVAYQAVNPEATCPLCIAMHSALPSMVASPAQASSAMGLRIVSFTDRVASRHLHFSLFSRPPPADESSDSSLLG